MTPADLVFLDADGAPVERIPGLLLREEGLAWKPGAQCWLERDALAGLFEALERMRRRGEGVRIATEAGVAGYAIRGVEPDAQLLRLQAAEGAPDGNG